MQPIGVGQMGNFHWWEGVVEDNLDPTGAGRCRVRVIAHNTPLKTELDTIQLPWAYPMMPLNNPHGKIVALKPGTRVFGFYRDGKIGQDLIMMGSVNIGYGHVLGFDEEEEPLDNINLADPVPRLGQVGFIDDRAGAGEPIENQPQKTKLVYSEGKIVSENISDYGEHYVNELNTSRLARGVVAGTIAEAQISSQPDTAVVKADGSEMPEPPPTFGAKYPYNTVEESDSGHVKEIDDTPGAERIKESHRTGTFYEIHPDGTRVTKVVKDDFSVTIGDKGVKVDGVCAVHVVGQADFYCESDIQVKTDTNATVTAGNDLYAVVANDLNASVSRDALVTADGNLDIVTAGEMSIQAGGEILFKDSSATASNVDEIIKDTVDGKGNARIRVDDPS